MPVDLLKNDLDRPTLDFVIVLDRARERAENVVRDYFGTLRSQLSTLSPVRSNLRFGQSGAMLRKLLILLG
ncbi:MAG: hypothetical protein WBF73_20770 [Bradyrhizobium sp.]